MRKATDGHYAIVMAAILEQDLEGALLTKMRPLTSEARRQLLSALRFRQRYIWLARQESLNRNFMKHCKS